MSDFADGLRAEIKGIASNLWDSRAGQVVPETDDMTLGNDRVVLDAVLLYADLADSTEMAISNQEIAAEVFKSYLIGVTRLIRANDGEVRSFDGDRVMGVFIGNRKNTNAAKCGLQVNWFFRDVLASEFRSFYKDRVECLNFDQTVGIDRSTIHVARAGIRDNNDLIWVGRAPNVAAKLSAIRNESYKTFITKPVYDSMRDSSKFGGEPSQDMWTLLNWSIGPDYGVSQIYGSGWTWEP